MIIFAKKNKISLFIPNNFVPLQLYSGACK
jgi:hypothetical protein